MQAPNTTYNKIGFHVGPGIDQEILELWLSSMSGENVPIFLTVAGDSYLLDSLCRRFAEPNTLVFQMLPEDLNKALGEEFNFQGTAFYEQNKGREAELAEKYWQQVQQVLPPNLMRDRVWLELLSGLSLADSPETQAMQADWLGEFATALARLVVEDQYKVAFWGWQSGQPDPRVWRTDGMLRLLYFSQRYPDNLGMSFHEFSGRLDAISPDAPGSGIGRFRHLWQICHEENITPPPIFISEWGWTRTRIPNPGTAVAHVTQANEELYAHFPEVRGAALWTLDRKAGHIANQVADLVDPLLKLTLNRQFEVNPPDPQAMGLVETASDTDPYDGAYDTAATGQGDSTPEYESVAGGRKESDYNAKDNNVNFDDDEVRVNAARLTQAVAEFYSEQELQILSMKLRIDYETLPADGKQNKVRELVNQIIRKNRLDELFSELALSRPSIDWPAITSGSIDVPTINLDVVAALSSEVNQRFDEDELKLLCYDLRVDYEDLPATRKPNKVRELVMLLARQQRIAEFVAYLKSQRPTIDWDSILKLSSDKAPAAIDPYADDTTGSQREDEEPASDKVRQQSLPGDDLSYTAQAEQTSAQQEEMVKALSIEPMPTLPAAESTAESDRPQQVWLKAPGPSELELLASSNNPLAEVSPEARSDDLLVWYWPERKAITHLFQVARHASSAIASQGVVQLDERLELGRPLTQTDVQHLPQLADWSLPQTEANLAQNLTVDGRWQALRGLILAWNPDLLPTLAQWEGEEEGKLWQTAVATAQQLIDKDERWQALTTLISAVSSQPDGAPLLADLRTDRDWRVRRAARQAQGEADTLDTLLSDATAAFRGDQYQDVLDILEKPVINWQKRGTDSKRAAAHTLLARAYEALGNRDQARNQWQQVAALNPTNPDAFVGLERNTPDEQLAEAEKFIQGLRKKQKNAAGPMAGLAAIAQRRNQFETAVTLLDQAIDLAPTADTQQQLHDQRQVVIQYVSQVAAPAAIAPAKIVDPRQNKLYEILSSLFSLADLRDLCVDLQMDAQDLPQDTRKNMAYALVQAVANQNRLGRLETLVKQYRPGIRHRFQDSVADLITQSQAMLPQHPERAIAFLEDQEEEWKQGDTPDLAAIHTVLAQAYTLTNQHDAAYLHWQRKAALLPDTADAFTGMVDAVADDQLDVPEQWMRDLQASHPDAAGPTLGLAAIARRRGQFEQAAKLLANVPAASLVQQRQMTRAAEQLRTQEKGTTTTPTAVSPPSESRQFTSNKLNLTLNDLSATATGLDSNDQLSVLQEFVQQTLDLPTLSVAHKRLLKLRSAQVLAEAERRGRITPQMLADLHLPALDYLFITQPPQRRALIRAVTGYRQQPGRRLALFLRNRARQQIRHLLTAEYVLQMSQAAENTQQEVYADLKTAVFRQGTVTYRDQPPRTLASLINDAALPPVKAWRTAANENALTIQGNLSQDVPAAAFQRLEDRWQTFWPLLYDLLHNQESRFRYLDSWGRFRRSPLPDAIATVLLHAFHADVHVPYSRETAVIILTNFGLADKVRQLDYSTYVDLAQNLLHDEDLGFDNLDDVALFLLQMAVGDIILDPDPAEPVQTPLHPPLSPNMRLQPQAIDTILDLPESAFSQMAAALNAGNHLILIGPPGTGKTTIAQDVCQLAHDAGHSRGFIAVTATADWTTFDTVGGYMPTADNQLAFSEGIVLRAIREQKWLIIDEINRADIDKAFGELFTVLSGQPVTLPYHAGHRPVRILPASYPYQSEQDYVISPTWRVIGTMNVYDKASLFEMSYAFMRRFAFVDIGIPDPDIFDGLITRFLQQANLPDTDDVEIVRILRQQLFHHTSAIMQNRPLGPAIARDMIRYMGQQHLQTGEAVLEHLAEAFLLYAVPQFDGLEEQRILAVFLAVSKMFASTTSGASVIRRRLRELFPQHHAIFPKEESFALPATTDVVDEPLS